MPARSLTRVVALGAIAALSLTACANGTDNGTGGGGDTPTDLIISTDLPLQGASASTSESTNNLIQLYLDQVGGKAGNYNIKLQTYDDSTAAKGAWDDAACAKNATDHVANTNEVAVMGTYNSGCAKIELPTLNNDNLLMVSHANTNPGLTKEWDPGEPGKYYPSGTRNFARVITTDDYQGVGAAAFAANDLKVKKAYVLNDNQTYGLGVARAFEENAQKNGIEIVGKGSWDAKQPNYTALFQSIKASGADIVYLGGIYDNNGGQLVKDKVSVLGPNDGAVKLLAPDGFTGYPDLLALDQSKGMYLTFAGLTQDQLVKAGGEGAKLLEAYQAKYNKAPDGSYPLYGVAAVQVILDAIAKSDGTRQSVTEQVLGGSGITIPADQSVLGKEIKIDPATGDTSAKDLTIEVVKDNKETFFKSQSIS
ncbi:amino acid/amide ABC transporter substrate-binding protein, HAAT family [Microlunatus sagamiharensis]|uniref:Amino acid/amide ABC transporter substrate-binding protein, HAAT family n=1 Tax=Microlunatus sagamiharensis TaxID=546874 RepID=A0A1H2MN31_9ACTN|nr:branched-chain amino acid ABC transporter substrate-binding protein [Microlunatus sagamiharensis]SDU94647.1 amino acid/amide ABC transporter substrate-binding protein, HAAT family [Microlunatus sagamiharensis]